MILILEEYLECSSEKWFLTGSEPDLSDIWILNGLIFMDCYDTSNMDGE